MMSMIYLAQMIGKTSFDDFRISDLEAAMDLYDIDRKRAFEEFDKDRTKTSPFVMIRLTKEDAVRVAKRSILLKQMYELWGYGNDLNAALKDMVSRNVADDYVKKATTWSVAVAGHNVSLNEREQEAVRSEAKSHLRFSGKVRIKNAETKVRIICEFEKKRAPIEDPSIVEGTTVLGPRMTEPGTVSSLRRVFIAREILNGPRSTLLKRYSLKTRPFIGPTSTTAELALLMANQALVRRGSLVVDTFVGTGSILVALAHHGAICFGTDIDVRILRGGAASAATIATNFKHYGFTAPELIRGDASTRGSSMLRSNELFDAVVCDPPYGIRAGARKSGSSRSEVSAVPESVRHSHIPQTQAYDVDEILDDLLDNSARMLRHRGRLVFLMPAAFGMTTAELPTHPCLRLRNASEERLTGNMSRWLITYEKTAAYDPERRDQYLACLATQRVKRPSYSKMLERIEELKSAGLGNAAMDAVAANSDARDRARALKLARLQIPTDQLYRSMKPPQYGAFDEDGVPTTDLEGIPISRSKRKKLRKVMIKHAHQRAKYLNKIDDVTNSAKRNLGAKRKHAATLDDEDARSSAPSHKWKRIMTRDDRRRRYAGKNVVVVGGASALERAVVLRLVTEGACAVSILDPNAQRGRRMANEAAALIDIDGRKITNRKRDTTAQIVSHFTINFSTVSAVRSALRRATKWSSDPNVVFVGGSVISSLRNRDKSMDWEAYEAILRVFAEPLRNRSGGSIVLMLPPISPSLSSTEKADDERRYVRDLVSRLSHEFGAYGCVRGLQINALAPGIIFEGPCPSVSPELRGRIASMRLGSAMEVSSAATFLGSPDASYINGTVLNADGGLSGAKGPL